MRHFWQRIVVATWLRWYELVEYSRRNPKFAARYAPLPPLEIWMLIDCYRHVRACERAWEELVWSAT